MSWSDYKNRKWWLSSLLILGMAMSVYYLWEPFDRIQGVNLLQSRNVGFDNQLTKVSLVKLKDMGANSVAFVPFISQDNNESVTLTLSDSVTRKQLLAGIQFAREAGLRIILKPQLLINGSWAGGVNHRTSAEWNSWFEAYNKILIEFAQIAESEQIDILVIGTEIKLAGHRPEWVSLIANVRQVYSGELSYSAHNLEGLINFAHWDLLDSASVTLYPSLGNSGKHSEMLSIINDYSKRLRSFALDLQLPLWVAEIGIASRQNAFLKPWEWQSIKSKEALVDELLQAQVLDMWLQALEGDWNSGVLVWAWYNDPNAGGSIDNSFSPQNKLAEKILHCHWKLFCPNNQLLGKL